MQSGRIGCRTAVILAGMASEDPKTLRSGGTARSIITPSRLWNAVVKSRLCRRSKASGDCGHEATTRYPCRNGTATQLGVSPEEFTNKQRCSLRQTQTHGEHKRASQWLLTIRIHTYVAVTTSPGHHMPLRASKHAQSIPDLLQRNVVA